MGDGEGILGAERSPHAIPPKGPLDHHQGGADLFRACSGAGDYLGRRADHEEQSDLFHLHGLRGVLPEHPADGSVVPLVLRSDSIPVGVQPGAGVPADTASCGHHGAFVLHRCLHVRGNPGRHPIHRQGAVGSGPLPGADPPPDAPVHHPATGVSDRDPAPGEPVHQPVQELHGNHDHRGHRLAFHGKRGGSSDIPWFRGVHRSHAYLSGRYFDPLGHHERDQLRDLRREAFQNRHPHREGLDQRYHGENRGGNRRGHELFMESAQPPVLHSRPENHRHWRHGHAPGIQLLFLVRQSLQQDRRTSSRQHRLVPPFGWTRQVPDTARVDTPRRHCDADRARARAIFQENRGGWERGRLPGSYHRLIGSPGLADLAHRL